MTARKRSDPQATRYRIAVAALAKAEKRKASAERSIAELRRKVRGYERRLPPDRIAEIHAGTVTAKAAAVARKDRWKEARRTLLAAARVAGNRIPTINELRRTPKRGGSGRGRLYGLWVALRESQALVWDNRCGYMTGHESCVRQPALLSTPTEEPPIKWRAAA